MAEDAYLSAISICKPLIDNPTDPHTTVQVHIKYAEAIYALAGLYNNHSNEVNVNRFEWVKYAEEALQYYSKLREFSILECDETIAFLNYALGTFHTITGNTDKVKAHYSKSIELFSAKKTHGDLVNKMKSWYQMHNRFSLRGYLHWLFVCDYQGSETKDPDDLLSFVITERNETQMYFSRESLLSIVDTDHEKEFFFKLLERINGKEITFIFKQGGGYFNNEAHRLTKSNMSTYLFESLKLSRVYDELGLRGRLQEKIEDKEAYWVGEFFEKLLKYAKEKYPQSFGDE